jgi:diguanylate cyclase (GGDEF)-like protein
LQHYLKNELMKSDRHHHPVSLLMIDIDDLKIVNDTYGHLAGDRLLKEIASELRKCIREIDVLARYGGDEFTIILTHTSKENAAPIADRIRRVIENLAVAVTDQAVVTASVSIGVAEYVPSVDTPDILIQRADQALYTAKSDGKNTVASSVPFVNSQVHSTPK